MKENMARNYYSVKFITSEPALTGSWTGAVWRDIAAEEIACFRPEGSNHHPGTQVKLAYTDHGIKGIFRVEDNYIRCVHPGFQSEVYKDSCVEIFLKPAAQSGYFNFEFNCGGSMRVSYITDHTRIPGGFKEYVQLTEQDCEGVLIFHSLPDVVDPEIQNETTWHVEFFIPFNALRNYCRFDRVENQDWRANFYKCADESSHPHWASWSPVDALNFHLPDCFGTIHFEKR